jgi:hypothetical protein
MFMSCPLRGTGNFRNIYKQLSRGLYIGKYPLPRGGGDNKFQPMSFEGKYMKRQREKGGKCERKMKKGERKRKKGERKL